MIDILDGVNVSLELYLFASFFHKIRQQMFNELPDGKVSQVKICFYDQNAFMHTDTQAPF